MPRKKIITPVVSDQDRFVDYAMHQPLAVVDAMLQLLGMIVASRRRNPQEAALPLSTKATPKAPVRAPSAADKDDLARARETANAAIGVGSDGRRKKPGPAAVAAAVPPPPPPPVPPAPPAPLTGTSSRPPVE